MILAKNLRCTTNFVRKVLTNSARDYARKADATRRIPNFKAKLPIQWVKPEKVLSIWPEKSGDGGLERDVKPQDLCKFYDQSKELEDADEIVRRVFSLEFAPMKETEVKRRDKTLAMVQRHAADRGSMESILAAMTSEILYLQEFVRGNPRDKKTVCFLKELIDKRKKFLGKLRRWDYKRFEWVLEKMNLVYKPHPPVYERIERKKSLRMLTKMHCEKLRDQKLQEYKEQLAIEKQSFVVEKLEKLRFIRNEELACGLEPTVTEDDIAAAKAACEEAPPKTTAKRGVRAT